MKISSLCLHLLLMESTPYKYFLDKDERRLRDRRYPRSAVQTFRYLSFYHIYKSKNYQGLVNAMGHEFHLFNKLLKKFALFYYFSMFDEELGVIRPKVLGSNGKPKGKLRDMTACGCLGRVLM